MTPEELAVEIILDADTKTEEDHRELIKRMGIIYLANPISFDQ